MHVMAHKWRVRNSLATVNAPAGLLTMRGSQENKNLKILESLKTGGFSKNTIKVQLKKRSKLKTTKTQSKQIYKAKHSKHVRRHDWTESQFGKVEAEVIITLVFPEWLFT